jgi:hypothetical protein
MHVGWSMVFLVGCSAVGTVPHPVADPLPSAVRAQAVSRVLLARPAIFRDGAKIDGCRIYLALDHDRRFTDQLAVTVRATIGVVDPEVCAVPGREQRVQEGETWWRLESIRSGPEGQVIVSAVVEMPSSRHREEATFTGWNGAAAEAHLVLREFRVFELIDSDSYPTAAPSR